MSTIDNLIDLKDDAVSLAYSVKKALEPVGEAVSHFDLPGSTARALLSQAESVIALQELHDQDNARELSDGVTEGIPADMLPEIPLHGERALTDFEFDLLLAAHRYMLDHTDKEALLVQDLKDEHGFKQSVNVIGTAFHRLFKKGYVNRFTSYGEATYWKPLTKEAVNG
jgi:hypothetical protein